jgi:hypothetical protein
LGEVLDNGVYRENARRSDTVQQAVAATQQAIVRVLTEGIDLQSLSVDERKKIVRLGLPRIIRLKENAPELDYSSFLRQNRYWKTNYFVMEVERSF